MTVRSIFRWVKWLTAPVLRLTCRGNVYANFSPTGDIYANPTPTGDVIANLTPTGEVSVDELI